MISAHFLLLSEVLLRLFCFVLNSTGIYHASIVLHNTLTQSIKLFLPLIQIQHLKFSTFKAGVLQKRILWFLSASLDCLAQYYPSYLPGSGSGLSTLTVSQVFRVSCCNNIQLLASVKKGFFFCMICLRQSLLAVLKQ